jgi:flagellar assembly factor FliW
MKIESRDFGEIEINKEDIIKFPQGLPGFLNKKEFVIIPLEQNSPFLILQSVTKAKLAFIVIDPADLVLDYKFEIKEKTEEKLKIDSRQDVGVLNIVTFKDSLQEMTANLAAPLVINFKEKLAKQVILDNEKYSVKYKVFAEEKKKQKVAE